MMEESMNNVENLTLKQKKALLLELMAKGNTESPPPEAEVAEPFDVTDVSLDMFAVGADRELSEVKRFFEFGAAIRDSPFDVLEPPRMAGNGTTCRLVRRDGILPVINLATYNYLGYSRHPEVIDAAKLALEAYGLGAGGAPTTSGTLDLHRRFEETIADFYKLPGRTVTLFSTGFGAMSGGISGLIKPGGCVVLDEYAHASLVEGAQLSGARICYFNHNDMDHLKATLEAMSKNHDRILVAAEGVYSAEGDVGDIRGIVALAKQFGALTFVDEAHSALLCGPSGRGIAEEQDVLEEVDMIGLTFSKAFGGIGGAIVAREYIARYVGWMARCRMFSCALDPAVTAGMTRVVELAAGADGNERRAKLAANTALMHSYIHGRIDTMSGSSWIVPVMFGSEQMALPLANWLQHEGLDAGIMAYPSVKKDAARLRLFITADHTQAQLKKAAEILLRAAEEFGFALSP